MLPLGTALIMGFISCFLLVGTVWLFTSNYRQSAAAMAVMAVLTTVSTLIETDDSSLNSFFAIETNVLATMAGVTFFWFTIGNRRPTQFFLALAYLFSSNAFGVELLSRLFSEPEQAQIMTASLTLWLTASAFLMMAFMTFIKTKLHKKHSIPSRSNVIHLRKHA